jgi:hypothetical protein
MWRSFTGLRWQSHRCAQIPHRAMPKDHKLDPANPGHRNSPVTRDQQHLVLSDRRKDQNGIVTLTSSGDVGRGWRLHC